MWGSITEIFQAYITSYLHRLIRAMMVNCLNIIDFDLDLATIPRYWIEDNADSWLEIIALLSPLAYARLQACILIGVIPQACCSAHVLALRRIVLQITLSSSISWIAVAMWRMKSGIRFTEFRKYGSNYFYLTQLWSTFIRDGVT